MSWLSSSSAPPPSALCAETPVPVVRGGTPVGQVLPHFRTDRQHVADAARLDDALRFIETRKKTKVVADHQYQLPLPAKVQQFREPIQAIGNGLFDEQVDSCLCQLDCNGKVRAGRTGKDRGRGPEFDGPAAGSRTGNPHRLSFHPKQPECFAARRQLVHPDATCGGCAGGVGRCFPG